MFHQFYFSSSCLQLQQGDNKLKFLQRQKHFKLDSSYLISRCSPQFRLLKEFVYLEAKRHKGNNFSSASSLTPRMTHYALQSFLSACTIVKLNIYQSYGVNAFVFVPSLSACLSRL